MTVEHQPATDSRTRIVEVASALLREGGPGAVTTRAVAERAGVQAPAIYRLFGDKDGLLEAVAEHVMAEHVSLKSEAVAVAQANDVDPVEELRAGWHSQIEFGLANPALFHMLSDPDRVVASPAARSGHEVLARRVHRIAEAGRLRVSEARATQLVQAAGIGAISTLLASPPEHRDRRLATELLDAVFARILTDAPDEPGDAAIPAAVALRALVPRLADFSSAERMLFGEWLARVIDATHGAVARR